jgi:hypothetical protein
LTSTVFHPMLLVEPARHLVLAPPLLEVEDGDLLLANLGLHPLHTTLSDLPQQNWRRNELAPVLGQIHPVTPPPTSCDLP